MDLIWEGKAGKIEVELAGEGVLDGLGSDLRLSGGCEDAGREPRDAFEDGRQGGAGVGKDEGNVGVAGDGAGEEEIGGGAGGVEEELEHGVGILW